ncbi:hypothetical protein NSZ01_02180 [Nocardioides szechwanensis]|uniref:Uncharacterized protein n=1 Tax=Nocardioides szechwanensis TaxID=1005944 RepID=A0A1G9X2H8_9ACTN|nr:hypothetical protein [Nocardioides szechwanensis]GEP32450.1 hypothetical protein NSZ01_02180 [Nocardioides szechwanensis]SDM90882.1 hypothetical protein SAMN05192576_1237 [Nocardioides szechwanensis]
MAANALDRIKSAASGAVVIGTAVAARAARTAGPLVGKAIGAIKSRVGDSPTPPTGTGPVTVTPAPARPAQPATPAEPAAAAPTKPSPTPTPAAVAKNIPPHPPQPASKTKKPVKKAAPGAKLPPRRKTEGT